MKPTVSVKEMDRASKNSPVMDSTSEESTVMMDVAGASCFWNGQEFDEGRMVHCSGKVYECAFGRWVRSD